MAKKIGKVPVRDQKFNALALTAPSGGGKGTAVKALRDRHPNLFAFSVSYTTRKPGENEIDGVHYFFVSHKKFKDLIGEGFFIEHEEIYGDFYGTPKDQFEKAAKANKVLLLDIDVKGAVRLKKLLGETIKTVFIDSGSDISVYEQRIRTRARKSDTEESIQRRLKRIPEELQLGSTMDYIFENKSNEERFIRLLEDVLVAKIIKPALGIAL